MKRVADMRAGLRGGSALFLSMAVMGSAMAQEPVAEEAEAIVVTGSRIARPDVESNSPVNVISQDEIKYSSTVETEQLLNALPQAVAGAGAQSNSGNGSATVNLRNLGTVRTLVLQNGRRIVGASQDGVVDLNMIPTSLISRVEVVTGGASAVYGSDAMAGVVNFVTKDDFEGFEIGGSYGISDEGDAERYNIDLTVGGNF
ncbi:MAG TPA: TonB-dependent receptor plug domain-containing protein, partial [Sphingopyxis sp.]|nr:TonB-dependent receptor plug domain-containing protein [Sphingopyxis sp.]